MLWTDDQTLSMAVMFLAGAALALFYDLCRIVAGRTVKVPGSRPSTGLRLSLWDLLIWLVVTPLIFAAALVSNRGELRLFVFIGLVCGILAHVNFGRPLLVAVGSSLRLGVARAVAGSYQKLRPSAVKAARLGRRVLSLGGGLRRLAVRLGGGFRRKPGE